MTVWQSMQTYSNTYNRLLTVWANNVIDFHEKRNALKITSATVKLTRVDHYGSSMGRAIVSHVGGRGLTPGRGVTKT